MGGDGGGTTGAATISRAPAEIGAGGGGARAPYTGLPLIAALYLAVVGAAAGASALAAVRELSYSTPGWPTFFFLAGGAAIAQLFTVRTRRNYSYHTTGVFLVPALLLLPASLVALLPVAQRIPDAVRRRAPWAILSFNIFNYTLAVLAAWAVADACRRAGADGSAGLAVTGLAAAVVFVGAQAALAAPFVSLARRCSIRDTGVFTFHGLSTEFVLAALGVGVAFLWDESRWLVPFALAPLLIVHRSLSVPLLEAEARVDPKTGLFNARHFAAVLETEVGRARRFGRPLAVVMADLDLLREINNTYGHLAGDAVLQTVADVFRAQLRHYDVPARFGGEEFAILLPETGPDEASEIAERIRRAIAQARVVVETAAEPIAATISIGLAAYPDDGSGAKQLLHEADLAVYRAKLQGRNRVVWAGGKPLVTPPELDVDAREPDASVVAEPLVRAVERRRLWAIGLAGIGAGALGMAFGDATDLLGMLALAGIVALVQALADEVAEEVAYVNAVGVLAGAALFGPRVALGVAVAACAIEWGRARLPLARFAFDTGLLALAALGVAGVFALRPHALDDELGTILCGIGGGFVYFAAVAGVPTLLSAPSRRELGRLLPGWTLLHHLSAGLLAGIVAVAYGAAGLWTLPLLAVPLLLVRSTQERRAADARREVTALAGRLSRSENENAALHKANDALRSEVTALMETLTQRVDARETVGHSREVQRVALAIGTQLALSDAELELLGHAALFHDIGKLHVPDAVLLKPDALTEQDWLLMRPHAAEGADLVERLPFLRDAVPAIRHHHERWDGGGYPDGLAGDDIPLGARIIHVAESVVAMLADAQGGRRTTRDVLAELRRCAGTQFCPRCVAATESVASLGVLEGLRRPAPLAVA